MNWYSFTGSDPTDSNHYTLATGTPSCLNPQQQLCAIQATDNGSGKPELDNVILSEMVKALNAPGNTTNVSLKKR